MNTDILLLSSAVALPLVACVPLPSYAVALPFSSVPVQFNISHTLLTGATTIYGNTTAPPSARCPFMTNMIIVNGSAAYIPFPSSVIVWSFSVVPAHFNICNTPPTGISALNGNTIATFFPPHPLVTNVIVINSYVAAVPFSSSVVALTLPDPLRHSRNLAVKKDLTLR